MAYYIDEAKKTAVRFEGKAAFAWNADTNRFDVPASDVSPKSRMTRASDFEARRYLFENHPQGYVERLQKLSKNVDTAFDIVDNKDLTAEIAESNLKAANELAHRFADEIKELQGAITAYGMQMSNAGQILSKCSEVLNCNIRIAECEVELVEINKGLMECEHGECADCERKDACKVMKRLLKVGLAEG